MVRSYGKQPSSVCAIRFLGYADEAVRLDPAAARQCSDTDVINQTFGGLGRVFLSQETYPGAVT